MTLSIILTGCSGGGVINMSVRVPANQRPDIDHGMGTTGALSVPATETFNISSVKSGQEGPARGEARAVGQDGVSCQAEACQGGTAWAEFQLGYCFDNVGSEPLDATVTVRFKVTESTSTQEAEPEAGASLPTAAIALKFFIKDTNGLLIKDKNLVDSNLEQGPQTSSAAHEPIVFQARFEPNRGYYLVIAGRVGAKAADSRSVAASLDVTNCSLEIAWRSPTTKHEASGSVQASNPLVDEPTAP